MRHKEEELLACLGEIRNKNELQKLIQSYMLCFQMYLK